MSTAETKGRAGITPKIDRHRTCPYRQLPDSAYWRRAVAEPALHDVDPVDDFGFLLTPQDAIATAGSCFAQHIARYLQASGCNYYVAEPAPYVLDSETAEQFQYGTFSARFGNLYTTRQLWQLFRRAYGDFTPTDEYWIEDGRFIDPYRPNVQPKGFRSIDELRLDREQHLACVRRMFESATCFVFTLGLTEGWENVNDGAVYPVCPGCGQGQFDAAIHRFVNYSVDDVRSDLEAFVNAVRRINPGLKIILTVSPVPLIATMSGHHVLSATNYSKSVLRVAAGQVAEMFDHVAYFSSYEIITAAASRGRYFAEDLRAVTEEGVRHVMSCFFRHAMEGVVFNVAGRNQPAAPSRSISAQVADVVCDEEGLVR